MYVSRNLKFDDALPKCRFISRLMNMFNNGLFKYFDDLSDLYDSNKHLVGTFYIPTFSDSLQIWPI